MKNKFRRLVAGLLSVMLVATSYSMPVDAASQKKSAARAAAPKSGTVGIMWEDPDLSNHQNVEVFPNTTVDDFNGGEASKELQSIYGGAYSAPYMSYNPGNTIATDSSKVDFGREDDTEAHPCVVDVKYKEVFSPKLDVRAAGATKPDYMQATKIAGITVNITEKDTGTDVTGDWYIALSSNDNGTDFVGDVTEPGLSLEMAPYKSGQYNVKVDFYVNFLPADVNPADDDRYIEWHKCSYEYAIDVKYGYILELFNAAKDGATQYQTYESYDKELTVDLTKLSAADKDLKTFEGWSEQEEAAHGDIIESTTLTWASNRGRYERYKSDSDARTRKSIFAVYKDVPDTTKTLSYELNGGNWGTAGAPTDNSITSQAERANIYITDKIPEKTDHKFLGWSTNNTDVDLKVGDFLTVSKEGRTVYALWEKEEPKVSNFKISIWGAPDDGKDFEFDGPKEDSKIEVTIPYEQMAIAMNDGSCVYKAADLIKNFTNYGSSYVIVVDGSLHDNENGVFNAGRDINLAWPLTGGVIDIKLVFVPYEYTIDYYVSNAERTPIKTESVFSGTMLEKYSPVFPTLDERPGLTFKGWNATGLLTDELATEYKFDHRGNISAYGVWEPITSTYVVKHVYKVRHKDGTVTTDGEVTLDPKTANVGQHVFFNATTALDVNVEAVPDYESAMGMHNYSISNVPTDVVIKEGEEVTFTFEYVRDACVGTVNTNLVCQTKNYDGEVVTTTNRRDAFSFEEGTTLKIDKDTGILMVNGKIPEAEKEQNKLDLSGIYADKPITYTIDDPGAEVKIQHSGISTIDIVASYTPEKPDNPGKPDNPDNPDKPEVKQTNVTFHHEYYLDDGKGNLTKEGEKDSIGVTTVGSAVNKAFHESVINARDASRYFLNNVEYIYTEYERTPDTTAAADNATVYTVKYKRVAGVKYTVKHLYFINNGNSSYVQESSSTETGEAAPGTILSISSSDPKAVIIAKKPTIELNGKQITYEFSVSSGDTSVAADGSTVFEVRYERKWTPNDAAQSTSYTVNHEYYLTDSSGNQTKEGTLTESLTANVGTKIGLTSDGTAGFVVIQQKPSYAINGTTYTYNKYADDGVVTVSQTGTVYTVKYMRQASTDATRLGQYIVHHDQYKQGADGAWVLEKRTSTEPKFASVGTVVGVKADGNNVTLDVEKMTFKVTENNKVKEYEFKQASTPVTISADQTQQIVLSYYYREYDVAQQPTNTGSPNTGSSNNTNVKPPAQADGAPKTGDDFKMSAMMPVSGVVAVICLMSLKKKKSDDKDSE